MIRTFTFNVERRAGWLFLLGNLQYPLAEALSVHLTPGPSPTRDHISRAMMDH